MAGSELSAAQRAELEALAEGNGNGAGPAEQAESIEPTAWPARLPLDLDPEADPEPPDYLVAGRIERKTVTVLAGDTGAAKSFTAEALAVATVEGSQSWLGRELTPRHRRAVVIDEENPERIVRARLRALGLTRDGASRLRYFHRLGARLGKGDWIEWLRAELRRLPADLLVVDTGTAAVAADLIDNTDVAGFYRDHLRPLADEADLAALLLLHERKPPTQGPRGARTMATLGARSWIGQADAQLMLSRRGEAIESAQGDGTIELETRFTLEVGKLRDGGAERREIVRVASTLDPRRTLLRAEVTAEEEAEAKQSAADRVGELLAEMPGMTLAQLAEETGYTERTVRTALGDLDAEAEGRPKRWHLPSGDSQEELLS
jgi:AAA domain